MEQAQGAIAVAVPEYDVEAMLQFAVEDAVKTSRDLLLVHVLRMPPSDPESYTEAQTVAHEIATRVLGDAARRAEELASGRVRVNSLLLDGGGGIVKELLHHTVGAETLMMQHRHLGRLRRLATGSTTSAIASRSHIPVVSIPEGWRAPATPYGVITVGVDDAEQAGEVLRASFVLADQRGATLRVLHAWWYANGWDDAVAPDLRDEWAARARHELGTQLASFEQEFPKVNVDVEIRHAPPAAALVAASGSSDLIVAGRRDPLLPIGSHLGPVARSILQESACPVMVVESMPHRVGASSSTLENLHPTH